MLQLLDFNHDEFIDFCIMCGCDIAEKSFEDNECESGCYPKMMNEKMWEQYKIDNKIQVS